MHVGDACNAQSLTGVQDCVAPIVGTFRWPGYDDSIAYPRKKWNGCPDRVGFCRALRAREKREEARCRLAPVAVRGASNRPSLSAPVPLPG